jgi:hypothetical protein
MRRINLLLQRPERKKYRKLRRWETLYGQIYGPKLVAQNFALEPWSLALGGYFTRHGQRSGATRSAAKLLRQLYQELRGLRGEHRWVLQLAEGTTQSHQRPEFLYSHLKQRFPNKNLERERRWIKRLRQQAIQSERLRQRQDRHQRRAPTAFGGVKAKTTARGGVRTPKTPRFRTRPSAKVTHRGPSTDRPARIWTKPYRGLFNLSSVRQLPRLALLRHPQVQLWWDTPQPIFRSPRYQELRLERQLRDRDLTGGVWPLNLSRRRRKLRRRLRTQPSPTQPATAETLRKPVPAAPVVRPFRNLSPRWRRRLRRLRALLAYGRRIQNHRFPELRQLPAVAHRLPGWLKRRLPKLHQWSAGLQRPSRFQRQQQQRRWQLVHRRRLVWAFRQTRSLLRRSERLMALARPRRLRQVLLAKLATLTRRRLLEGFRPRPAKGPASRRARLARLRRQRRSLVALLLSVRRQRQARRAVARALGRLARRGREILGRLTESLRENPRQRVPRKLRQSRKRLETRVAALEARAHRTRVYARQPDQLRNLGRGLLQRLMWQLQPGWRGLARAAARRNDQREKAAAAAQRAREKKNNPSPAAPRGTQAGPAATRRSGAQPAQPNPHQRGPKSATQRTVRKPNRPWRLAPELQPQRPPFNPQQWRKLADSRWRTLQAQQPYGLTFYWEAPRSGQLGRWRRRGSDSQPSEACRSLNRSARRLLSRRRLHPAAAPLLRRRDRGRRQLRRRLLAHQPQIHYHIRELHLQDLVLLEEQLAEEGEDAVLDPGQRYLLVTRRYGAVGYGTLLRDCFSLLTPQLRLRSQVVGHKSARRTIYQARAGVSLAVRVRTLFGWLRELVNKNDDYNLLRRNTTRKSNSKRVRDKPERSRRCTQSFYPRLATELKRLLGADEPLLEQLALFDARSVALRVPRRHYRWEN